MADNQSTRPILFFDGECNLCNGGVQFIIRHDGRKRFLFAPLQSAAGKEALQQLPGPAPDSMILLYKGRYYVKSDASLHIARLLGGLWPLCYAGMILPRAFRNRIYDYIARHRYQWWGKRSECMIPTPELRARFLP